MTAEDLLRAIVEGEPLTWSHEGLDDGCFFCGADDRREMRPVYVRWADHEASCPWVLARRLFGIALGRHTAKA